MSNTPITMLYKYFSSYSSAVEGSKMLFRQYQEPNFCSSGTNVDQRLITTASSTATAPSPTGPLIFRSELSPTAIATLQSGQCTSTCCSIHVTLRRTRRVCFLDSGTLQDALRSAVLLTQLRLTNFYDALILYTQAPPQSTSEPTSSLLKDAARRAAAKRASTVSEEDALVTGEYVVVFDRKCITKATVLGADSGGEAMSPSALWQQRGVSRSSSPPNHSPSLLPQRKSPRSRTASTIPDPIADDASLLTHWTRRPIIVRPLSTEDDTPPKELTRLDYRSDREVTAVVLRLRELQLIQSPGRRVVAVNELVGSLRLASFSPNIDDATAMRAVLAAQRVRMVALLDATGANALDPCTALHSASSDTYAATILLRCNVCFPSDLDSLPVSPTPESVEVPSSASHAFEETTPSAILPNLRSKRGDVLNTVEAFLEGAVTPLSHRTNISTMNQPALRSDNVTNDHNASTPGERKEASVPPPSQSPSPNPVEHHQADDDPIAAGPRQQQRPRVSPLSIVRTAVSVSSTSSSSNSSSSDDDTVITIQPTAAQVFAHRRRGASMISSSNAAQPSESSRVSASPARSESQDNDFHIRRRAATQAMTYLSRHAASQRTQEDNTRASSERLPMSAKQVSPPRNQWVLLLDNEEGSAREDVMRFETGARKVTLDHELVERVSLVELLTDQICASERFDRHRIETEWATYRRDSWCNTAASVRQLLRDAETTGRWRILSLKVWSLALQWAERWLPNEELSERIVGVLVPEVMSCETMVRESLVCQEEKASNEIRQCSSILRSCWTWLYRDVIDEQARGRVALYENCFFGAKCHASVELWKAMTNTLVPAIGEGSSDIPIDRLDACGRQTAEAVIQQCLLFDAELYQRHLIASHQTRATRALHQTAAVVSVEDKFRCALMKAASLAQGCIDFMLQESQVRIQITLHERRDRIDVTLIKLDCDATKRHVQHLVEEGRMCEWRCNVVHRTALTAREATVRENRIRRDATLTRGANATLSPLESYHRMALQHSFLGEWVFLAISSELHREVFIREAICREETQARLKWATRACILREASTRRRLLSDAVAQSIGVLLRDAESIHRRLVASEANADAARIALHRPLRLEWEMYNSRLQLQELEHCAWLSNIAVPAVYAAESQMRRDLIREASTAFEAEFSYAMGPDLQRYGHSSSHVVIGVLWATHEMRKIVVVPERNERKRIASEFYIDMKLLLVGEFIMEESFDRWLDIMDAELDERIWIKRSDLHSEEANERCRVLAGYVSEASSMSRTQLERDEACARSHLHQQLDIVTGTQHVVEAALFARSRLIFSERLTRHRGIALPFVMEEAFVIGGHVATAEYDARGGLVRPFIEKMEQCHRWHVVDAEELARLLVLEEPCSRAELRWQRLFEFRAAANIFHQRWIAEHESRERGYLQRLWLNGLSIDITRREYRHFAEASKRVWTRGGVAAMFDLRRMEVVEREKISRHAMEVSHREKQLAFSSVADCLHCSSWAFCVIPEEVKELEMTSWHTLQLAALASREYAGRCRVEQHQLSRRARYISAHRLMEIEWMRRHNYQRQKMHSVELILRTAQSRQATHVLDRLCITCLKEPIDRTTVSTAEQFAWLSDIMHLQLELSESILRRELMQRSAIERRAEIMLPLSECADRDVIVVAWQTIRLQLSMYNVSEIESILRHESTERLEFYQRRLLRWQLHEARGRIAISEGSFASMWELFFKFVSEEETLQRQGISAYFSQERVLIACHKEEASVRWQLIGLCLDQLVALRCKCATVAFQLLDEDDTQFRKRLERFERVSRFVLLCAAHDEPAGRFALSANVLRNAAIIYQESTVCEESLNRAAVMSKRHWEVLLCSLKEKESSGRLQTMREARDGAREILLNCGHGAERIDLATAAADAFSKHSSHSFRALVEDDYVPCVLGMECISRGHWWQSAMAGLSRLHLIALASLESLQRGQEIIRRRETQLARMKWTAFYDGWVAACCSDERFRREGILGGEATARRQLEQHSVLHEAEVSITLIASCSLPATWMIREAGLSGAEAISRDEMHQEYRREMQRLRCGEQIGRFVATEQSSRRATQHQFIASMQLLTRQCIGSEEEASRRSGLRNELQMRICVALDCCRGEETQSRQTLEYQFSEWNRRTRTTLKRTVGMQVIIEEEALERTRDCWRCSASLHQLRSQALACIEELDRAEILLGESVNRVQNLVHCQRRLQLIGTEVLQRDRILLLHWREWCGATAAAVASEESVSRFNLSHHENFVIRRLMDHFDRDEALIEVQDSERDARFELIRSQVYLVCDLHTSASDSRSVMSCYADCVLQSERMWRETLVTSSAAQGCSIMISSICAAESIERTSLTASLLKSHNGFVQRTWIAFCMRYIEVDEEPPHRATLMSFLLSGASLDAWFHDAKQEVVERELMIRRDLDVTRQDELQAERFHHVLQIECIMRHATVSEEALSWRYVTHLASDSFHAARTQEALVTELAALQAELLHLNDANRSLTRELEDRVTLFGECNAARAECADDRQSLKACKHHLHFAGEVVTAFGSEADRLASLDAATTDAETTASALSTWLSGESQWAPAAAAPPLMNLFLGGQVMTEGESLRDEVFAAFRGSLVDEDALHPLLATFDRRCQSVSDRCSEVMRVSMELLCSRQSEVSRHTEFMSAMMRELEVAFDSEMSCLDVESDQLMRLSDESTFHMCRGSGTVTRPRAPDAVEEYHAELSRAIDADAIAVHRRSQLRLEHEWRVTSHEVKCLKDEKQFLEKDHQQRSATLSAQYRALKSSLDALNSDADALKATNLLLQERHLVVLAAKNSLEISATRRKLQQKPRL